MIFIIFITNMHKVKAKHISRLFLKKVILNLSNVFCFRSQAQGKRQVLLPEMDGRSGTTSLSMFICSKFSLKSKNYRNQFKK